MYFNRDFFKTFLLYSFLAAISFLPFLDLILYTDDWTSIIGRPLSLDSKWIDFETRRPLTNVPFLLLHNLFGHQLLLYYIALILILIAGALSLYILSKKIGFNHLSSLYIGSIYLIFPGDYTHLWLTMIGTRSVILLTIVGLVFWYLALEQKKTSYLFFSVPLIVLPFYYYEAQLGVVCLFVLFSLYKTKNFRRYQFWIWPLLGIMSFIAWRLFAGGSTSDPYWGRSDGAVGTILNSYMRGCFVLYWTWTEPLNQLFGFVYNWFALLLWLGYALICWLVTKVMFQRQSISSEKQHVFFPIKELIMSALFVLAGYFPIAIFFYPSLGESKSRISIFASFGFCFGLIVFIQWLCEKSVSRSNKNFMFHAIMFGLLTYSISIANATQYSHKSSWQTTKDVWRSIFSQIPDLKDSTVLGIIISSPYAAVGDLNRNWKRAVFRADWEVAGAAKLLYQNKNLETYSIFLTEKDASPADTLCKTPDSIMEKAVFFEIDLFKKNFQLIKDNSPLLEKCLHTKNIYKPEHHLKRKPINPALRSVLLK